MEIPDRNKRNVLKGIDQQESAAKHQLNELVAEMDMERWQVLVSCKKQFLNGDINALKHPYIYPEIAASWLRSADAGVDHQVALPGYRLTQNELRALFQDNRELVDIVGNFMNSNLNLLASSGYYMSLVDKNGILLLTAGDKRQVERLEQINAYPGAVWGESIVGTNCHTLCIELKKPVQIMGPYYYCEAFYDNLGSGTPLFDENGDLLGVLLVIDVMDAGNQHAHPHLLAWVKSSGLAVESQLKLLKHSYNLGLTSSTLKTTMEALEDACITLNQDGFVTSINRNGLAIFGIGGEDAEGKSFAELLGIDMTFAQFIKEFGSGQTHEITIDSQGTRQIFMMDIDAIYSEKQETLQGLVLHIHQAGKMTSIYTGPKRGHQNSFEAIKGDSKALRAAINRAKKVTHYEGGILLCGESGTGKDLFAQAIHEETRADGPFIVLNCAALPRNLIESELFGYEGGAFTGAERSGRKGKIELAHGGTLFLDEIGDMPLDLQPVLLRVLEDHKVMRIGGKNYIPVDCRVIAATNQDLAEKIEQKQFRGDLYYRLAVFRIDIPPLRTRGDDIIILAEYFMQRMFVNNREQRVPQFSDEVCQLLKEYAWPGNIRQLENAVSYALAMSGGKKIRTCHLPEEIITAKPRPMTATTSDLNKPYQTIGEIERKAIQDALNITDNNIIEAAHILGIGRSTLYRRIKEYNILLK